MNFVIAVLLGLILVVLLSLAVVLDEFRSEFKKFNEAFAAYSLQGRARQRRAVMRDIVLTDERVGERLKKQPSLVLDSDESPPSQRRSRRRVMGGDPDSELHRSMSRGVADDDDGE